MIGNGTNSSKRARLKQVGKTMHGASVNLIRHGTCSITVDISRCNHLSHPPLPLTKSIFWIQAMNDNVAHHLNSLELNEIETCYSASYWLIRCYFASIDNFVYLASIILMSPWQWNMMTWMWNVFQRRLAE